jgi:hypothetical protein
MELFMKKKLTAIISTIVLMGFISIGTAHSQDASKSHEEHHPDSKTTPEKSGEMKMDNKEMNGMEMPGKDGAMDKKDMAKMNGMMKDCMKMHKDKKMCDQNTMEKCQMDMKKEECQKMMKEEKTKAKK